MCCLYSSPCFDAPAAGMDALLAATPGGPEDVTKAALLVLQWGCVLPLTSYLISSLLA